MNRLRHEAGQTVVLFAILLPLFLGMGALAVDVGYWYVIGKTAQDAADSAALAAARELPNSNSARTVAEAYVEANMPGAEPADVEFPYMSRGADVGVIGGGQPDYTKIRVTVTHSTGTFFGRLFGVVSPTVSRRAVAERLGSDGNLAIFSFDDNCLSSLEFAGSNQNVNGLVHSNGQFRIGSGPFWAADGSIYGLENCRSSVDETVQSQFGDDPGARLPRDVDKQPWPTWYTPAQLGWFNRCTYKGTTIEISATTVQITQPDQVIVHGGTIPSGSYCATESIHIAGDGLRGRLTALAPDIAVDGSDHVFLPFTSNVLFFTIPDADFNDDDGSLAVGGNPDCQPSPAADMQLNGSGHKWLGVIFSPCGRIVVNLGGGPGGGPALEGTIVGLQVRVEGNHFGMIGKGDFEYSTALVE